MTTLEFESVLTAGNAASHLTPERWAAANRHLIRKALAEFSHERILVPEPTGNGDGGYRVRSDDGTAEYRFSARILQMDHWSVDAASITCRRDGQDAPLDALRFITELSGTLGIRQEMLPIYLEEISSTLSSHAFKQWMGQPSSAELAAGVTRGADAATDFQTIERSMTEGHPCFVANNGRLGFGIGDYRAFAPEAAAPVQLEWIAVHRSKAVFTSSEGLDYAAHLEAELGAGALAFFDAELGARGLDPAQYFLMPVHPWQWENKLTVTFAAEIAQRHIVHLGIGADRYQAQQSIRTFFNSTAPGKTYVKTAMSVLNMGFMRGLSPQYMKATPAINDWLQDLIAGDEALQGRGLAMIREVAAIGYHNGYYEAAAAKESPYRKMLSALWRESPLPLLKDGQQLATMASLLHVDAAGKPMVSALIEQSGMEPGAWLRQYFEAYLVPLVHCLYRYELAFMPHGENVILVLENGVPVRAVMKDIAEEIVVMGDRLDLPEAVSRIKVDIPDGDKVLSIFTDVFDCIFRFLAALLEEDGVLGGEEFWRTAAAAVRGYQAEHPELADQFARHDLFAPDFELSCLNRLQLRNNQQMLDLADPSGGLQKAGRLANPLATFA
ncbi:putative siderophore biosynthesis protein [Arthrobacter globiformis NBRC 12137]|uniref:Putative siderophore biosynthesis protein n=1 Tax=Arthrobacter globiformis (strain ATCC 8010 / DSM 20124 / JCM 1332 / NBRC 12137 / NCIMB 8907 / NRRL B-2979 / 168) TaxID=1077972 RepID=H0QIZ4_ARTG1|nr:IucA/IucC family siderophore biosynthesis protein [Arthrobacter globiformis]GAB12795.1 putative siderophore biosynthesis protein [Arthrobacter globiformis NBRC 12137]